MPCPECTSAAAPRDRHGPGGKVPAAMDDAVPHDASGADHAGAARPVNVADYEALAAQALPAGPLGYYAGGAEDERTLRDNVAAWGRRRLRPRVLVDVSGVTTATTVLGTPV